MRNVDLQALILSLLGLTVGRHHGWARGSVTRSKNISIRLRSYRVEKVRTMTARLPFQAHPGGTNPSTSNLAY